MHHQVVSLRRFEGRPHNPSLNSPQQHKQEAKLTTCSAVAPISASSCRPLQGYINSHNRKSLRSVKTPAAVTETAPKVHDKHFKIGEVYNVWVTVEAESDQFEVRIETDHPSEGLYLHWGVTGGLKGGGWRLPGENGIGCEVSQPPGSINYKNRALQTPFSSPEASYRRFINITLAGAECSQAIAFVLTDKTSNTWYDRGSKGDNFLVLLPADGADGVQSTVPDLPGDLCGVWAYMKWIEAGSKEQSEKDRNAQYQDAVQELHGLLQQGYSLDTLYAVSKGKPNYQQFMSQQSNGNGVSAAKVEKKVGKAGGKSKGKKEKKKEVEVPFKCMEMQAYILWHEAGRPWGADFGDEATRIVRKRLVGGEAASDIEQQLRARKKAVDEEQRVKDEAKAAEREKKQKEQVKRDAVMESLNIKVTDQVDLGDPMRLVKAQDVPKLSEGPARTTQSPLTPLLVKANSSNKTQWARQYQLGNKAGLLVVIRKKRDDGDSSTNGSTHGSIASYDDDQELQVMDSPMQAVITSDSPVPLTLHWGVLKQGNRSKWNLPPTQLLPMSTKPHTGGLAVETDFRDYVMSSELLTEVFDDDERSTVSVPMQRVVIDIPQSYLKGDTCLTALTFVLRSTDGSSWFRDGTQNFRVPLPFDHGPGEVPADEDAVLDNDIERSIVDYEMHAVHWTLMHRFNKVNEMLCEMVKAPSTDIPVEQIAATMFVWLRYSAQRQLTWQRNYNTQPRILSGAQSNLTSTIAWAYGQTRGEAQDWVRLMLSTIGRGGDGQKIRDEILHIMHRHHISETAGHWMEQWHQKLHNNTTPDDVHICEAYIAFLESGGNNDVYWRVLSDAGISRSRLETFDRPITTEPSTYDKAWGLVPDFKHYLGILKSVHSGADLYDSAKHAGYCVPNHVQGALGYILMHQSMDNASELQIMQSAIQVRAAIGPQLPGNRELLYLDLALEGLIRKAAERVAGSSSMQAAVFITPLLQNLVLTAGDNEELCYCLKAWNAMPAECLNGGWPTEEQAKQMMSVVDRIRRSLVDMSMRIGDRVGGVADRVGKACGVEGWVRDLFAEEVIRGGPAFALSLALCSLEPTLQKVAKYSHWQIICPRDVSGKVTYTKDLIGVQDVVYPSNTILVVGRVSGEEEVPEGVVAIISHNAPDVLSHIAVRARNTAVLFAACRSEEGFAEWKDMEGKLVTARVDATQEVVWEEGDTLKKSKAAVEVEDKGGVMGLKKWGSFKLPKVTWGGNWVLGMQDYLKKGAVGAKARNLAELAPKVPAGLSVPVSVSVPFGTFERVLDCKENAGVKGKLKEAIHKVPDNPAMALKKCRKLCMELTIPSDLKNALQTSMEKQGMAVPWTVTTEKKPEAKNEKKAEAKNEKKAEAKNEKKADSKNDKKADSKNEKKAESKNDKKAESKNEKKGKDGNQGQSGKADVSVNGASSSSRVDPGWEAACVALKSVWASKFNDRAYYSLRKVGLNFIGVNMAVLVQQVLPAQYAFVIHTTKPTTQDPNIVYAELVLGLGETLVSGSVPGSALRFEGDKGEKGKISNVRVIAYPSKSEGMFVEESLIFRSDSNGEDLPGYAGAGLYESVTTSKAVLRKVDYSNDPLMTNQELRNKILTQILQAGADIEKVFGSAQDIEGVVTPDNKVHIVQSRPQV